MKKTLLATALAVGFASAASAQTSVTLYGRVDGGFGYEQYKFSNSEGSEKITRTGLFDAQQNGNRWGLRGSEDLGGGLKAIFTLESGFNIATGNSSQGGRLFGRTAIFGLQSDSWGAIKLGRDYNFGAKYMPTVVSPHGDIYGLNSVHNTFTSGAGTVRADNLISYETPVFSGFQFGIGYSFNYSGAQPYKIKDEPNADHTLFTTGLKYSNGPLTVAASYDQLNKRKSVIRQVVSSVTTFVDADGVTQTRIVTTDAREPLANDKSIRSWILGASYDFDVATLHLGFGQDRNGTITPHASDVLEKLDFNAVPQHINNFKANNYSVGVGIPVESGKIMVNWQSSRLGSGVYKDGVKGTDGGKTSQSIYTLAYRYDLSKRTNFYVSGAYATGYGFTNTKGQEIVAGLSHAF